MNEAGSRVHHSELDPNPDSFDKRWVLQVKIVLSDFVHLQSRVTAAADECKSTLYAFYFLGNCAHRRFACLPCFLCTYAVRQCHSMSDSFSVWCYVSFDCYHLIYSLTALWRYTKITDLYTHRTIVPSYYWYYVKLWCTTGSNTISKIKRIFPRASPQEQDEAAKGVISSTRPTLDVFPRQSTQSLVPHDTLTSEDQSDTASEAIHSVSRSASVPSSQPPGNLFLFIAIGMLMDERSKCMNFVLSQITPIFALIYEPPKIKITVRNMLTIKLWVVK